MNKMMTKARKGATFIEYAMLAGLVAIVVAVAAMFFGDQLKELFTTTGEKTAEVNTAIGEANLTPKVAAPSGNNANSNPGGGAKN